LPLSPSSVTALTLHAVVQAAAKAAGMPWAAAKGWDTSCPVSAAMVPAAAVSDYTALNMWLDVNGERKMFGSPKNMIFDLPTLLEAVTTVHTLEPGDLLLTGTPEGVGAVGPGDVITAGIAELPALAITTPVVPALSIV
jgi:2-keto-4-pentenoate hydratase/2-oxohepta-3-ene-1,7-dioic acid hydratase in catechol pathway